MSNKKMGKSKELAAKVMFAALQALKDNNGELPVKEVFNHVEKRVPLDDWAKAQYEKSGYIRWQSILHFFSIDCVKAGFLVKKKGIWYLTPEGEEALKLGAAGLLDAATNAYSKWRSENPRVKTGDSEEVVETEEKEINLDQIEQSAIESFEQHIRSKNPYELQDLVAALLRGMGYYTPFVAPKGKDGGVDIVAYRDPLGTSSPRIKVQIKHRESPSSVQDVRQLMGLLQKDDVGIFVSTGGFTADTRDTARASHVHVELIDLQRLISLWQEFYPKLTDEDKSLMPLLPINFLAPLE